MCVIRPLPSPDQQASSSQRSHHSTWSRGLSCTVVGSDSTIGSIAQNLLQQRSTAFATLRRKAPNEWRGYFLMHAHTAAVPGYFQVLTYHLDLPIISLDPEHPTPP